MPATRLKGLFLAGQAITAPGIMGAMMSGFLVCGAILGHENTPEGIEKMQTRRVVITGMGSISPFGRGVDILIESLFAMKSGVANIPGLADFGGLRTHVAAVVP